MMSLVRNSIESNGRWGMDGDGVRSSLLFGVQTRGVLKDGVILTNRLQRMSFVLSKNIKLMTTKELRLPNKSEN